MRGKTAHDLTEAVGGARVGVVDGSSAAPAVVGQRAVHLVGSRMHGDPFRTVHLGGADNVRSDPGVDQQFSLAAAKPAIQRRVCVYIEGQPLPAAVLVKASNV